MITANKFFIKNAIELYENGNTLRKISLTLDVSRRKITRAFKKLAIPIRTQSESISGEKHFMYGKHHTIETRRKISKSHEGLCPTTETLRKLRETHKGKYRGKDHQLWKGDKALPKSGSRRCVRIYEAEQCKLCGNTNKLNGNLQRHHKDKDTLNNLPQNIIIVCAACHRKIHSTEKTKT